MFHIKSLTSGRSVAQVVERPADRGSEVSSLQQLTENNLYLINVTFLNICYIVGGCGDRKSVMKREAAQCYMLVLVQFLK